MFIKRLIILNTGEFHIVLNFKAFFMKNFMLNLYKNEIALKKFYLFFMITYINLKTYFIFQCYFIKKLTHSYSNNKKKYNINAIMIKARFANVLLFKILSYY